MGSLRRDSVLRRGFRLPTVIAPSVPITDEKISARDIDDAKPAGVISADNSKAKKTRGASTVVRHTPSLSINTTTSDRFENTTNDQNLQPPFSRRRGFSSRVPQAEDPLLAPGLRYRGRGGRLRGEEAAAVRAASIVDVNAAVGRAMSGRTPERECLYCGWPMHVGRDERGAPEWRCTSAKCGNTVAIARALYDAWIAKQAPR